MKTKITIQNVVASATFKQTFDVNAIAMAFPDIVHRPNVFPGLVFKLKSPKTCALIFHSGRMVCVGAKSERLAERAIMEVAKQLKEAGIVMLGRPEIKIANIVASVHLGGVAIDLLTLCETGREFRGSIFYEPDQFPSLIYRMKSPRVVFLIFSTGTTEKLVAFLKEKGVMFRETPKSKNITDKIAKPNGEGVKV